MDYKKTADEITLQDVMSIAPVQIKKAAGRSGEMLVYCPHQPKCTINVQVRTGEFKCFHECIDCPVGGRGRSVNLYRLYNPSLTFKQAVQEITGEQKFVPTNKKIVLPVLPEKTKEAELAPIEERDKTYRTLLSLLNLDSAHEHDLIRRGLQTREIREFGAKSLPECGMKSIPMLLVKAGCKLKGVPFFGKDQNGKWQVCLPYAKTGYLIPYFDQDGHVEQLQIRFDVPEVNNQMSAEEVSKLKNARYRWATSSFCEDGSAATNIPFWGRFEKFHNASDTVVVTEGGLKATVASYISDQWYAAIPGVTCYEAFREICEYCKKANKKIVEAFDMDGKILDTETRTTANKVSPKLLTREVKNELSRANRFLVVDNAGRYCRVINGSVYNALAKLREIAAEYEIPLTEWKWDPNYKGIDDFLDAQKALGNSCRWDGEQEFIEEDITDESEESQNYGWPQNNLLGPVQSDNNDFYVGTFMPVV